MLEKFNSKSMLIGFMLLTILTFVAVIFWANPMIDGKDGNDLIRLQLSFFKSDGIEIVRSWGSEGINNFKKYIFTDYIYAFAYTGFFVTLLSRLIVANDKPRYTWLIYVAILAGLFDWIENSIEILFMNNLDNFSETLFFIHSIIASLKWLALPIALAGIFMIRFKKSKNVDEGSKNEEY